MFFCIQGHGADVTFFLSKGTFYITSKGINFSTKSYIQALKKVEDLESKGSKIPAYAKKLFRKAKNAS